jgi:hypothetical protein
MATPPIIVNRRPQEGDIDTNALEPFRYGLRDIETRVILGTVYSSAVYARAVYRPTVLPLEDPVLSSENIRATFSIFNDAAGDTVPNNPADQTIETIGPDQVYRIERTTVPPQEGFLYVSDDAQGDNPYSAEVKLNLGITSVSTADYVTYVDFTGVIVGFIIWPENTGVFLFFRDDGTKRVTIGGPSNDGIGTRPVETTVVFDWSADIFTYKIFWDENPKRRKVIVIAVDSAGIETVLAEFATTAFNQFLNSVVLGGFEAANPPDKVVLVVGTDGPTPGDRIDVYKADLFRFGRALVIEGGPTGSSVLDRRPNESLLVREEADFDEWGRAGEGTLSTNPVSETILLTRLPVLDSADLFEFSRGEPDLSRKEWFLILEFTARDSQHLGTFNTGIGIDIEDGSTKHIVRLLNDFFINDIGVHNSGPLGDDDNYFKGITPIDWTQDIRLILLGSDTKGTIRAYLVDDEEIIIDTGTYPASVVTTESKLSIGFVDLDFEYYGVLSVASFWFASNAFFYEPSEATFPEAQGWTRIFSGGTRSITGSHLTGNYATTGEFDIYHISDPDYDEESGASIWLKGKVSAWTDEFGAVSPPRKEIGPIAFLASTTVGVQLYFVESETGRRFVYLPRQLDDVVDVMAQNVEGARISAELDFTEFHAYQLVLKPFQHIRLYVDYSTAPAIEIPWESASIAMRTFPTNVPPTSTIAFGSLGEESGVEFDFSFVRASIGTGYDLIIRQNLAEEDLQNHVYGSEAELLTDFEDVDP